MMQPTGEEEAHAAHVLCCWWYWQTVCRQTLNTVHLEVGDLVIQIDYDDLLEWMPEVVAGLWWLRNPTTRLRRKSAWLWRQTEKVSRVDGIVRQWGSKRSVQRQRKHGWQKLLEFEEQPASARSLTTVVEMECVVRAVTAGTLVSMSILPCSTQLSVCM